MAIDLSNYSPDEVFEAVSKLKIAGPWVDGGPSVFARRRSPVGTPLAEVWCIGQGWFGWVDVAGRSSHEDKISAQMWCDGHLILQGFSICGEKLPDAEEVRLGLTVLAEYKEYLTVGCSSGVLAIRWSEVKPVSEDDLVLLAALGWRFSAANNEWQWRP